MSRRRTPRASRVWAHPRHRVWSSHPAAQSPASWARRLAVPASSSPVGTSSGSPWATNSPRRSTRLIRPYFSCIPSRARQTWRWLSKKKSWPAQKRAASGNTPWCRKHAPRRCCSTSASAGIVVCCSVSATVVVFLQRRRGGLGAPQLHRLLQPAQALLHLAPLHPVDRGQGVQALLALPCLPLVDEGGGLLVAHLSHLDGLGHPLLRRHPAVDRPLPGG